MSNTDEKGAAARIFNPATDTPRRASPAMSIEAIRLLAQAMSDLASAHNVADPMNALRGHWEKLQGECDLIVAMTESEVTPQARDGG